MEVLLNVGSSFKAVSVAFTFLPVVTGLLAEIQAAKKDDGKIDPDEIIKIASATGAKIVAKVIEYVPDEKAKRILKRVEVAIPVVTKLAAEIEDADDADSPGGRKVTLDEVSNMVAGNASDLLTAMTQPITV